MAINRADAPSIVYVVYSPSGELKKSFIDEDDAYEFADSDDRVVTYDKAGA